MILFARKIVTDTAQKMWLSVPFVVVFFLSCVKCVELKDSSSPSCTFPAIYNFGDSNSDTGGISAAFQPIPAPYGVGFFHKPFGRDSDGRVILDFIGNSFFLSTLSSFLLFATEKVFLFLVCTSMFSIS
jgi:hypothetical protein